MSELFTSLDFYYIRILPLLLLISLLFASTRGYARAALFTCNRIMLVYGLAQLFIWYQWYNFYTNQPVTGSRYPVTNFQYIVIGFRFLQVFFPLLTISKHVAASWLFAIVYWLLLCWLPIYNSITIGQVGIRFEWIGELINWIAYIAFFALSYTVFWWMSILPFQKKQHV